MSERAPKVDLVPWDCESVEHVERMYQQRVNCGWRSNEVRESWVDLVRAGSKAMYWIVLRDDLPGRDELLSRHLAQFPEETPPIHDTAAPHHHFHLPRARRPGPDPGPDRAPPLVPVGHLALERRPEQDARLGIAGDGDGVVVWVTGLYVSHALQAGGIGRDAMRRAEELAAGPPLRAVWVALDTMPHEQQKCSAMIKNMFTQARSAPTRLTQDWYERQGYQAFFREVAGYTWVNPKTGDSEDIDYLFLRKRLQ